MSSDIDFFQKLIEKIREEYNKRAKEELNKKEHKLLFYDDKGLKSKYEIINKPLEKHVKIRCALKHHKDEEMLISYVGNGYVEIETNGSIVIKITQLMKILKEFEKIIIMKELGD